MGRIKDYRSVTQLEDDDMFVMDSVADGVRVVRAADLVSALQGVSDPIITNVFYDSDNKVIKKTVNGISDSNIVSGSALRTMVNSLNPSWTRFANHVNVTTRGGYYTSEKHVYIQLECTVTTKMNANTPYEILYTPSSEFPDFSQASQLTIFALSACRVLDWNNTNTGIMNAMFMFNSRYYQDAYQSGIKVVSSTDLNVGEIFNISGHLFARS